MHTHMMQLISRFWAVRILMESCNSVKRRSHKSYYHNYYFYWSIFFTLCTFYTLVLHSERVIMMTIIRPCTLMTKDSLTIGDNFTSTTMLHILWFNNVWRRNDFVKTNEKYSMIQWFLFLRKLITSTTLLICLVYGKFLFYKCTINGAPWNHHICWQP